VKIWHAGASRPRLTIATADRGEPRLRTAEHTRTRRAHMAGTSDILRPGVATAVATNDLTYGIDGTRDS
jgi:hypothetical protein